MIEEEFAYFKEHQPELYETYPDKYLIIRDKEVLAAADTIADAMDLAAEMKLEPGSYLLQLCGKDEWAYKQVFHSRVSFT